MALPRIYWDVSKEMARISETRENRNNGNNTIVAISVQQCMNCVKKDACAIWRCFSSLFIELSLGDGSRRL